MLMPTMPAALSTSTAAASLSAANDIYPYGSVGKLAAKEASSESIGHPISRGPRMGMGTQRGWVGCLTQRRRIGWPLEP